MKRFLLIGFTLGAGALALAQGYPQMVGGRDSQGVAYTFATNDAGTLLTSPSPSATPTVVNGAGIDGGVLPTAPLCTTRSYGADGGLSVTASTTYDIAVAPYACNRVQCSVQVNQLISTGLCDGGTPASTAAALAAWTPYSVYTVKGETHWCVYASASGTCWSDVSN